MTGEMQKISLNESEHCNGLVATKISKSTQTSFIFLCGPIKREGGIGSIVRRTTSYLSERGKSCAVVAFGGVLSSKLHPSVLAIPGHSSSYRTVLRLLKDWLQPSEKTVIVSYDPRTTAFGVLLSSSLRTVKTVGAVKHVINILHPREFYPDFENSRSHRINQVLGKLIGSDRFIYMNLPVQLSHETFFGWTSAEPIILAVPMDKRQPIWTPRLTSGKNLRICSVGRIVPFKSYNFEAVHIARLLGERGIEIVWDIFGYGEEEKRLKQLINQQKTIRVHIRGELPIDDFDKTVSKYDVFIGMGLAAIQAAQLGVPTILAIESDGSKTYGWFNDAPFGIVGENIEGYARYEISDLLQCYSEMTSSQKKEICSRQLKSANMYGMEEYIDGLITLVPNSWRPHRLGAHIGALIFLAINSNSFRRMIRSIMRNQNNNGRIY